MKRSNVSRRDFLRLSALTGAGAVLAACAPQVATTSDAGGDAGGGGSMFINQGNNVQNVSRSISPTFIVNQDTVLTTISKSLAM